MIACSDNYGLVALSVVISVMSAFTGLSLTRGLSALSPAQKQVRIMMAAIALGGGTRIGGNLAAFNQAYARRLVSGRSVVLILSDGFCPDPPALIGAELARLKRRGCRILWLNPLKGRQGHAPVAAGMAADLPHLDLFAAANTLASLAALEPELARL